MLILWFVAWVYLAREGVQLVSELWEMYRDR